MNRKLMLTTLGEGADEALVAAVKVKNGDLVRTGDIVVELETYKAIIAVPAEEDGTVVTVLVAPEAVVRVPCAIMEYQPMTTAGEQARVPELQVSPRARRLLAEHRLTADAVAAVTGRATVDEAAVRDFLRQGTPAKAPTASVPEGKLAPEFVRMLREEDAGARGFFALPGEEKIRRYRAAGACIGDGVVLAYGAGIVAESVLVGDGVMLGRNTMLRAGTLAIGGGTCFEEECRWQCRRISIGANCYIAAESRVGWGGEWSPTASLEIGDNCHIGEQAMLNPGEGVAIGDTVSVGAGSKVYTHQFWQSVLDGYVVRHAPVRIGRYTQLGANVVVLPGSSIGEGMTVSANALVAGEFAGPGLLSGAPARQVQRGIYPYRLADGEKQRKAVDLLRQFAGRHALHVTHDGEMAFAAAGTCCSFACGTAAPPADTRITLGFGTAPEGATAHFDLAALQVTGTPGPAVDLLREFLRRQGVRFAGSWRYRHVEVQL